MLRCRHTIPLLLLLLAACSREEDSAPSRVQITFRTDNGYTFMNDTLGVSDTVRVGVRCTEGTDALERFYLAVSYDDSAQRVLDTVRITTGTYTLDSQLVMRAFPGRERWSFIVEEGDGDRTQRSLDLVVQ